MKTNSKQTIKRFIAVLTAIVMILGMMPVMIYAGDADCVYISVSYDAQYICDKNGDPIAYIPVSFEALTEIDLDEYGLSEYLYDEDDDGISEITALQLIIYAHEVIYGGSWDDVIFTGGPGSSYFQGGIFGFDENLNYYLNGQYPLASAGWGATSDQIVLEPGDFIDLASFTSWDFYQDSAYGFHYFADSNNNIVHGFTAEEGTACNVKLIKGTKDYEYNSIFLDVPEYKVFYGTELYDAKGTVITDENGCAEIVFPSAGTWYLWADGGYGNEYSESIVSAPGYAKVTVASAEVPEPETPREAQDVGDVLDSTMEKLVDMIDEPAFGTSAGEWTVFGLARGGYFAKDSAYFADYYERIVETVNETAETVDMNGALHKNKSTENSRLIVALSAIGKDATSVGDWDLIEAYSANGFNWIKRQGLNGTIWALIALDSNNYSTTDATIRQQCVDAIISAQHDDGGWALSANLSYESDPDVTGMALTALYPYRNQPAVAAACEEAFECLSEMQHENGTFASGGSECAESCAWVIVACTAWGINPDTDARFIKDGNSVVDGLLSHYLEDMAQFEHIIGAGANGMATDQSCYALVAYDRFVNGKPALYDYSDVVFDEPEDDVELEEPDTPDDDVITDKISATLGLPKNVSSIKGTKFNAVISVDGWDNNAGYKLIDFIVAVPEGLSVTGIKAGDKLDGGEISYHLEDATGKLRVVYFDANEGDYITVDNPTEITELFTIGFEVGDIDEEVTGAVIAITGMSAKTSSDSSKQGSQVVIDTDKAQGVIYFTDGIVISAMTIYTGDDIDLIPSDKMAVVIAITNLEEVKTVTYVDGDNEIEFYFSPEMMDKSGIDAYVALVDSDIRMEDLADVENYKISKGMPEEIYFGDINGDDLINAQDALAIVNAWIRKSEAPDNEEILLMNVNGDSRINTYDALAIVEYFVDRHEWAIITKASTLGKE